MNKKYLTVTALTKYIKRKLDTDPHLKNVWLQGEISNFNHHSRGHMYFTIKDNQTRIQAVMFAGQNRRLKFTPENGMSVLIKGEVSVFESFGQYQLYVHQMEPDGIGSLYMAFEQLKEKLSKRGLFANEHKRKVPSFPERIGIITSPTGAAIRDILTTLHTRYPITSVTIIPALVQGELAANSIVQAIELAHKQAEFDVLIVARGGGSLEDLWPFNEEVVAQAIFHSTIPIISAIGHETDITISDFVADLRAPTPTGAAILAVPSQQELLDKIKYYRNSIVNNMNNHIQRNRQNIQQLSDSYAFKYPDHLIKQKEQELDRQTDLLHKGLQRLLIHKEQGHNHLQTRIINQIPQEKINQSQSQLDQSVKTMKRLMQQLFNQNSNELQGLIDKLSLLNPLEVMKRGFAIPYTEEGKIIKSRKHTHKDEVIEIELVDGMLDCKVVNVRGENNDK